VDMLMSCCVCILNSYVPGVIHAVYIIVSE
jgi:uncharacterized membrane protein YqaE (UPF0057 family)